MYKYQISNKYFLFIMKYFLCLCVVSVERRVLAGYARFHLMLLCHDHRSAGHQATQPGHGGQCGHRWTAQIITRILFSHTQTDHHQAHLHIYHRMAGGGQHCVGACCVVPRVGCRPTIANFVNPS